jgi:hypothetical protein
MKHRKHDIHSFIYYLLLCDGIVLSSKKLHLGGGKGRWCLCVCVWGEEHVQLRELGLVYELTKEFLSKWKVCVFSLLFWGEEVCLLAHQ